MIRYGFGTYSFHITRQIHGQIYPIVMMVEAKQDHMTSNGYFDFEGESAQTSSAVPCQWLTKGDGVQI